MKLLLSVFFIFLLFTPFHAFGQYTATIETSGIINTGENTPFWLHANRRGIYSGSGSQFLTRLGAEATSDLGEKIRLQYGAELIARPGPDATASFNLGYLQLRGYGFEFAGGRFKHTVPMDSDELSLGAMGISRNATPVPKIRIGLENWTGIPFTGDLLSFYGHLAHGWLGSERYTEKVLLHEKTFYLRAGNKSGLNLYGGLTHFAMWGGKNHPEYGDIPTRFRDFADVVFAFGGDNSTPGPDHAHSLGNHTGAWDFGFHISPGNWKIKVYRQFPYEDFSNLFFKSYMDALTGISLRFPENSSGPFDRVLYEYLYTKFQAGPRESRGDRINDGQGPYRYNENYYNHYIYRTGWVYNKRTLGNPLFTPADSNTGILNNRIIAHHFGFVSSPGRVLITGKATFSRNYGKRCDNRIPDIGEGELFGIECTDEVIMTRERSLDQWSFLLGAEIPVRFIEDGYGRMSAFLHFAFDNGLPAGDQSGVLAGLRWTL